MSPASVYPSASPIAAARRALGSADYATAESVARRALEYDAPAADRAEAGLLLGRVLARTGRPDECVAALRSAIESEEKAAPPSAEVRFDLRRELGQALWAQNRQEEASRWFLAALDVRPDAPEDAEARRLILDLELLTLVGSGEVDRAAEYALDAVDAMLAHGLTDDDWHRVLEILGGLSGLKSTEVDSRIVAWFEAAEAHCTRADDAEDGTEAQRDDALASVVEYAQGLKQAHPRDLGEADVRELEQQFELAWTLMESRQLVDWLGDASGRFYLARTGWKSVLTLWRRVFERADRYVGCAGSPAWDELTDAARHLTGWCHEIGDLSAAAHLRRLVFEADRSLGHDFSTAISGRALAQTLLAAGHPGEALRVLDEATEYRQRDRSAGVALGAWARRLRADILAATGDLAGAEVLIRDQMQVDALEHGEDSALVGWDALRLAELLADMGRTPEAAELLARAVAAPEEDVDSLPGNREWAHLVRRLRLGKLRLKLEEGQQAVEELFSVAQEAAELLGCGHALEAEALTEWAVAACGIGIHDVSVEEAAARALRIQRHLRNSEHPKAIRAAEVVQLVGA